MMRRFSISGFQTDNDDNDDKSLLDRQFVVRDQDEFITSFDPADGATLTSVVCELVLDFHKPDGEGYDNTDLVIWRNRRIVAIVRLGDDGHADPTIF